LIDRDGFQYEEPYYGGLPSASISTWSLETWREMKRLAKANKELPYLDCVGIASGYLDSEDILLQRLLQLQYGPAGQGGDPYQNGHGETIYTMDQFINANKSLTRSEIINQRQDRSKTFLGSQPGGPNMRYVVNPHDGRVLDMRHMLVVGKQPVAVGNLLEVFQWGTGQASGMDRQDFYSNGVGYQFYMQYSGLQNLFYPNTFTDQMRNFFYNPRVIYNW
jgi:hypothetical protein